MKTYLIDLFSKKTKTVVTTYFLYEDNDVTITKDLICITYKSGKTKFKTVCR